MDHHGPPTAAREPTHVLATVLAQHHTLRIMFRSAHEIAEGVLSGEKLGLAILPEIIHGLCSAFEQHLAMEEALVLPILESGSAVGLLRAQRVREEHARQRGEMRAVAKGRVSNPAAAERVLRLVNDLLIDMAEEEYRLMTRDYLTADPVSIDQSV
jgi:iron-sulfur cluster repair protein YtfE (RIC family)